MICCFYFCLDIYLWLELLPTWHSKSPFDTSKSKKLWEFVFFDLVTYDNLEIKLSLWSQTQNKTKFISLVHIVNKRMLNYSYFAGKRIKSPLKCDSNLCLYYIISTSKLLSTDQLRSIDNFQEHPCFDTLAKTHITTSQEERAITRGHTTCDYPWLTGDFLPT